MGQRLQTAAKSKYQALIDSEAEGVIAAGFWERADGGAAVMNGSRAWLLSATAGDLGLQTPKARTASFSPSLQEGRRRIDQALFVVIVEAQLHGVSAVTETKAGSGSLRFQRSSATEPSLEAG